MSFGRYKTQDICDKAVSINPFMLKYYLDRYETHEMCDKAVNNFLPELKFVRNWLDTSKFIKNFIMLYSQIMIYSFLMKILAMWHFLVTKRVRILSVDLHNINLDYVNLDENERETIIHITLLAWRNKLKQRKAFKIYLTK